MTSKESTPIERFNKFKLSYWKEWLAIRRLPPVVIRLFGDIDYQEQLGEIEGKFKHKVIILTTSDSPENEIQKIKQDGWRVIQSKNVDTL